MSHGEIDDREIEAFGEAYPEVVEALRDGVHDDHAARVRAIDAVAHRLVDEPAVDVRESVQSHGRRWERRTIVRLVSSAMAASALALISGYVIFVTDYIGTGQDTDALSANNPPIELSASVRTGSINEDENGATYVFFEATESGLGTKHRPYQTLEQAINSAEAGGVIKINGGSTSELLRIAQPVRLVAVDGTVRIGRS